MQYKSVLIHVHGSRDSYRKAAIADDLLNGLRAEHVKVRMLAGIPTAPFDSVLIIKEVEDGIYHAALRPYNDPKAIWQHLEVPPRDHGEYVLTILSRLIGEGVLVGAYSSGTVYPRAASKSVLAL